MSPPFRCLVLGAVWQRRATKYWICAPQILLHGACLTCAVRLPGTPDADQALFEEILVECTAFQLAGALTEASVKEAVDEVAELVLSRAPGAAGSSGERAAGGAQSSESAASRAAQAAVSAAVSSTGRPPSHLDGPWSTYASIHGCRPHALERRHPKYTCCCAMQFCVAARCNFALLLDVAMPA